MTTKQNKLPSLIDRWKTSSSDYEKWKIKHTFIYMDIVFFSISLTSFVFTILVCITNLHPHGYITHVVNVILAVHFHGQITQKDWKSWKCNAHHYMMERTLTCLMFSAKKPSNNIIENVGIVVKTTIDQRCGWISWCPCPPSITLNIILELSNNPALRKEAEMPSETNP